jgi:hypothetical protein
MLSEGSAPLISRSVRHHLWISWYYATAAVLTKSQPASALRNCGRGSGLNVRAERGFPHTDNHDIAKRMNDPTSAFGEQAA